MKNDCGDNCYAKFPPPAESLFIQVAA